MAVREAGWGYSLLAVGIATAQGGCKAAMAMEGVVLAAECCLDLARDIFFGVGIGINDTLPTQFGATNKLKLRRENLALPKGSSFRHLHIA